MKLAYAKIGNDDNSRKFWIPRPLSKTIPFEVPLIINSNQPEFSVKYIKETNQLFITPNEKTEFFVNCDADEAEYILLPYYNNSTDFIKVVEYKGGKKFVVRQKMHIETRSQIANGITLPNGRENHILGIVIKANLPTQTPKFEGDMDTLIEVTNPRVKYIKIV